MEQENSLFHICCGAGAVVIGEIGAVAITIAHNDYNALSSREYSDAFTALFYLAAGGVMYSAMVAVFGSYPSSKPDSHSPQVPPKESNLEKKLK